MRAARCETNLRCQHRRWNAAGQAAPQFALRRQLGLQADNRRRGLLVPAGLLCCFIAELSH
jgi:hypothetical protein